MSEKDIVVKVTEEDLNNIKKELDKDPQQKEKLLEDIRKKISEYGGNLPKEAEEDIAMAALKAAYKIFLLYDEGSKMIILNGKRHYRIAIKVSESEIDTHYERCIKYK